MLRCVGIGAGQQEAVVGVVALSGPDLLPVDDPLVTIEHGTGLQRRQVGARVRLAEALAPARLALQDRGQELLLLFLSAPLQDRRADERVAEEVGPQRCLGPRELLRQHDTLHRGEPLAAVLDGPRGADPAAGEQLRRPLVVELLARLRAHLEARLRPAGRQVLVQPRPDLAAERLGVGGIAQVHETILTRRSSLCRGDGVNLDASIRYTPFTPAEPSRNRAFLRSGHDDERGTPFPHRQ